MKDLNQTNLVSKIRRLIEHSHLPVNIFTAKEKLKKLAIQPIFF